MSVQAAGGPAFWRRAFSSLATRNYRLYFIGQVVSLSGTWMQTVAQSILVLQLTHSGTILGLTIAARFAPLFLLAPVGGVAADRGNKRRILYVTQALSGLLALAFGLLTSAGVIRIWMVFALAAALGLVNVFDTPTRQAFIPELVPGDQVRNAVTLNSISANMARILGAAVGGGITAVLGVALCFDLNAVSFLAVIVTIALMSSAGIAAAPPAPREKGELRAGLSYVRTRPQILLPLIMVAVVGTLAWEFQVSLPLIATGTFHGGANTYGTMTAAMGAGAVAGGMVSASRTSIRSTTLAFAAIGWGVAITAAALAPSLVTEYAALVFVGYGSITFNSLAKTTLQLAAEPAMRGRVMALWGLAWQGSTPVGGPVVGVVAAELGPRFGLLIGGVPTVLIGLVLLPALLRMPPAAADPAGPAAEHDSGAAPAPLA